MLCGCGHAFQPDITMPDKRCWPCRVAENDRSLLGNIHGADIPRGRWLAPWERP